MRIRTQLILASFVLAVVPLAMIVTYSYHSSRRALEAAERREAERMAQQMDRRLASIRADLDERLTLVSSLPVSEAGSGESIAAAMGDVTSLVESLEYKPLAPDPEPKAVQPKAGEPRVVVVHEDAPVVPPPPPPGSPVFMDLPTAPMMPAYEISEKQRELLDEIGNLGGQLTNQNLDADEREDLRRELAAAQKELNAVIAEDTRRFRMQSMAARRAARDRQRRVVVTEASAVTQAEAAPAPESVPAPAAVAPAPATPPAAPLKMIEFRGLTPEQLVKIREAEKKTMLILGTKFKAPVRKQGEVVGQLTPSINPERVIRRVLGGAREDGDEISFAIDREGNVYTRTNEERATLDRLSVPKRVREGKSLRDIPGWIVSATTDAPSGMRIGVARPVGANLGELRRTAARNLGLGMGLIVFALIGIIPLSNHLTRDVKIVTDGAERIAQGDLMTRLPVKTKNELGQLARAFNRMAEDLSHHQQKLLEQERTRKEQEIHQRVLAVEYERKSVELEDARRFQLSMLPKEVPQHDQLDIAVYTRTATEVGGDYYDFHAAPNGVLSVTIGDATGHGAKAGTMVTVIKTLFSGYGGSTSPAEFLRDAAEKIKRMELGRMSMALSVGCFDGRRLTLASAGMPPVLVHRASTGEVSEVELSATPLGTLGTDYPEKTIELASGDTVLFLTDGFPELMNDAGQQFGYTAALEAFATAARAENANGVIASLVDIVRRWHGDAPPNDDVTFVVTRVA